MKRQSISTNESNTSYNMNTLGLEYIKLNNDGHTIIQDFFFLTLTYKQAHYKDIIEDPFHCTFADIDTTK